MGCGVGCRHGSNPALLWLWGRPAAMAPIGPLAWELPYASGVAKKWQKDQKNKIKQTNKKNKSKLEGVPIVTWRVLNLLVSMRIRV